MLVSCYTIYILRSNIDENFRWEKYRIYIIVITYTFLYSITFTYHVILLYKHIGETDQEDVPIIDFVILEWSLALV